MVAVCEVVVGELPFAAPAGGTIVAVVVAAAAMALVDIVADISHKKLTLVDVLRNLPVRQPLLLLVVLVAA